MRNIRQLCILTALISVGSGLFSAQNLGGVYLGVDGGFAPPAAEPSLNNFSAAHDNYAVGGTVGYRYAVGHHLSTGVEANYTDFGKTNYNGNANVQNATGSFKNSAIQVLLTGTYLMDNGFNTFLKVGAAQAQTNLSLTNSGSASVTSWIPAIAAGLGYKLVHNLNLYAEYERTLGQDWGSATVSNHPDTPASVDAFTMGVNYTLPM